MTEAVQSIIGAARMAGDLLQACGGLPRVQDREVERSGKIARSQNIPAPMKRAMTQ
jgi:hypothetical protein